MYAVGDAYKVHTECIQADKKSKREEFFFYFFFIACVPSSFTVRVFGHSRTPSSLTARLSRLESPSRLAGQEKSPASTIPDAGCGAVRGDMKAVFRAVKMRYAPWTHSGACGGDPTLSCIPLPPRLTNRLSRGLFRRIHPAWEFYANTRCRRHGSPWTRSSATAVPDCFWTWVWARR